MIENKLFYEQFAGLLFHIQILAIHIFKPYTGQQWSQCSVEVGGKGPKSHK
jgi:hypothetical protein